jgi:hypothetical protein
LANGSEEFSLEFGCDRLKPPESPELASTSSKRNCKPEMVEVNSLEWEGDLFESYQMIFLKQQLLEVSLYIDKAQSIIF